MSIQSEITRIEGAVDEQAALIAQIQAGLEGKATGGGGTNVTYPNITVVGYDDSTLRFFNNDDLTKATLIINGSFSFNGCTATNATVEYHSPGVTYGYDSGEMLGIVYLTNITGDVTVTITAGNPWE